ncbi:MAG: acetyltransferase [Halioglobus sp.]|jgi:hypothetical protein
MLLKRRSDGHLLEVQDLQQLFSVFEEAVVVRDQVGEEEQDPESINKAELVFLSGEALPRCWTDPQYRDDAL